MGGGDGRRRLGLDRGNQTALSGPEHAPPNSRGWGGEEGAGMLTAGLAGWGALWGPPAQQQCPAARPPGPPEPQQSLGLLEPGQEGAAGQLSR